MSGFNFKYAGDGGSTKLFVNNFTGNNSRTGYTKELAKASTITLGKINYLHGSFSIAASFNNPANLKMIGDGFCELIASGSVALFSGTCYGASFIQDLTLKDFTELYGITGAGAIYTTFYNVKSFNCASLTGSYFHVTYSLIVNATVTLNANTGNFAKNTLYTNSNKVFTINNLATTKNLLLIGYRVRILASCTSPKNIWFDSTCTFNVGAEGTYTSAASIDDLRTRCRDQFGAGSYLPSCKIGDAQISNASIYDFSPKNIELATFGDDSSYVGWTPFKRESIKIYTTSAAQLNSVDNMTNTNLTITNDSALLTSSLINGEVYSKIIGNGLLRRIRNFDQFLQQAITTKEHINTQNQVATSGTLFASLVNSNDYKVSVALRILTATTINSGTLVVGQKYLVVTAGGNWVAASRATGTNGDKLGSVLTGTSTGAITWGGGVLQLMSDYTANSIYRNTTGDAERNGEVLAVTLVNGGTGYATNDISYLTDGASDGYATVKITGQTGGVVTSISLVDYCGTGYTTGIKNTTNSVGTGSNLTVNITSVRTTPIYYLVTEKRFSISLRWIATNLNAVSEISSGTILTVGASYVVTTGSITYNSTNLLLNDSFTVLSGLPTVFTGMGKIKQVFSSGDVFYPFSLHDNIRCTTKDNNNLTVTKSNLYLTTGDPNYYTDVLATTKSEKDIFYTYYQIYFKFLVSQI